MPISSIGSIVPNLVICEHDRDQHGLGTNRPPNILRIHKAVAIHRQNRQVDTALRQGPAGIEDSDVLNRGSNHVLGVAGSRCHSAENRVVVRLRAAAGKHDFRSARAQRGRHRRTRLLHRSARVLAEAWIELALPYSSLKYGSMAASTSGATGVVALWSK